MNSGPGGVGIGEKTWVFDSNVITPGTDFMHRLAKALRGYILER
jgi:5'-3' exonuclease